MSKTKTFERGHFWSNFVQTFFIWCQITKILRTIFFLLTGQISGVFGEFVCGNSWRAGRRSLKFIPRMLHVMAQKKLENDKFLRTALHCEFYIWNKQIFLPHGDIELRYLELRFLANIQLVPKIMSDSLFSKCKGSRICLIVSFQMGTQIIFERKWNWSNVVCI